MFYGRWCPKRDFSETGRPFIEGYQGLIHDFLRAFDRFSPNETCLDFDPNIDYSLIFNNIYLSSLYLPKYFPNISSNVFAGLNVKIFNDFSRGGGTCPLCPPPKSATGIQASQLSRSHVTRFRVKCHDLTICELSQVESPGYNCTYLTPPVALFLHSHI